MRRFVLVLSLAAFILSGCGGDGDDPVLAEIGTGEIRASDLVRAYDNMKPGERPPLETVEQKQTFLEDLISKEVMEMTALEAYPELVERQTWRLKRYRDKLLTDYARDHLIRDQVRITEEMMDRIYANLQRERHLLAMLIPDPDAAAYVAKQLEEGAEFGPLAADHSMQWVSDKVHGDMGWTHAGTLPYPVDIAAWEAPIGATIGPIQMARGSYIVRVLEERPSQPQADRTAMGPVLNQWLLEPLYLDRQKAVQDSLREATDPYVSPEAKALLTLKYYWEVPEEESDNPMAVLDANRVVPTFTPEEAQMVVVDFKEGSDWTAAEFAERLSWYPGGLWPRGQSEEQLMDCIDMMIRDHLYIKAARDLGYENEEFEDRVDSMSREMRVTYFYYNNIMPQFEPNQAEIDSFFEANREQYRAPESYKVAFFGSPDKALIEDLHKDWLGGMSFVDLLAKYEARSENVVGVGESEWLYVTQDPVRDEIIDTLREGGICEPVTRSDVTMVFKLVARRPPRLLAYGEVKEQVEKDAKTIITDTKLSQFLQARREEIGVKVYPEKLEKVVFSAEDTERASL